MLKIYLLQVKLVEAWHLPFHLLGGGPNPLSLKLSDSGQIPVSYTPIMTSLSVVGLSTCLGRPRKSHDLVVWSSFFWLGNTDTTPSIPTYSLLHHFVMNSRFFLGGGGVGRIVIRFTHQPFFELLAQLDPLQIHGNSFCSYRVKILDQYGWK